MNDPAQPNPYAPPLTTSKAAEVPGEWPPVEVGLWRDGAWLVARRDAKFPLVCPVTNEAAITRVPSYFPWAAKDLYPLRFGLVVGVLYYLTQVKHTLLLVPITSACQASRRWRLSVGCLAGLAALALLGFLFQTTTQQAVKRQPGLTFLQREGKVLTLTVATFGCIVLAALVLHGLPDPTKSLPVHGVLGVHIWLSGAHADFLQRLAPFAGERP